MLKEKLTQTEAAWFLRASKQEMRRFRAEPKIDIMYSARNAILDARRYYLEGSDAKAINTLKVLVENEPTNPEALYERGRIRFWLGKSRKQQANLQTGYYEVLDALNLAPNNLDMLNFCAQILAYSSDNSMNAEEYVDRALAIDSANIIANKIKGDLLAVSGDENGARQYYQISAESFERKSYKFIDTIEEYAVKRHYCSDYEPTDVIAGFAGSGVDSDYLATVGVQYMRLGDYDKARQALDFAAKLEWMAKDSKNGYTPMPEAYLYLGIIELKMGNIQEAIYQLSCAREYDTGVRDATNSFALGIAWAANARTEKELKNAQELMFEACDIYPFENSFVEAAFALRARLNMIEQSKERQ